MIESPPEPRGFEYAATSAMYRCVGAEGSAWPAGDFGPVAGFEIPPAAAILGYGLGVFEGLKARRGDSGRLLLFRVRDHGERLGRSAERLLMTPFPADGFVDAVHELVRRNAAHVPRAGSGALYVRPMEHCVEPMLGGRRGREFQVVMFTSPVAEAAPDRPGVALRTADAARCAPGGTGAAKAVGNYASALAELDRARSGGFQDVLFLDARESRLVTETSGANVFARLAGGTVVTPRLTDEILPGITRDSALSLLRDSGTAVEERPLPIDELLNEAVELFCTGTGVGIRPVATLRHGERQVRFGPPELARELDRRLRAIREGREADPHGWVEEVAT